MLLITLVIFFSFAVVVRSYKHIDNHEVSKSDLLKAIIPAAIAIICLTLRGTYFALPEEGMVSLEYLNYRKIFLWGFLAFMGYILRALIYSCVYAYRKRNKA